jgi:hypothetical protein
MATWFVIKCPAMGFDVDRANQLGSRAVMPLDIVGDRAEPVPGTVH